MLITEKNNPFRSLLDQFKRLVQTYFMITLCYINCVKFFIQARSIDF